MTTGGIPQLIEARTLAARGVVLNGRLDVAKMPRLSAAIVAAEQPVDVNCAFFCDEEGRYVLNLQVSGEFRVDCQRCLSAMPVELSAQTQLAVVWTDEQAAQLPARYDPLLAEAETDLWSVVEDELLLALPAFSYHADTHCGENADIAVPDSGVQPETENKTNPFDVLAALKEDTVEDPKL